MKLIKIFHKFRPLRFLSNDVYLKAFLSIGFLALISIAIWMGGDYISWGNQHPLAQPEKKIYTILILFLLWVLKFLIIDLANPNPENFKDPLLRKKIQELHNRFQGALQFLKKTVVARHGKSIHLNHLPWFLLIGPTNAGKTALLANSGVNFILQRRLQQQDKQHFETSQHCDWWVTRDATIIDVPGKYIYTHDPKNPQRKPSMYPILWRYFLRLIKKQKGKNALGGLIITLPLPQILLENDTKKYQASLHNLFERMSELQKLFPHPIPCQLVITKCDLLSGFTEFFAESTNDETIQAWGVSLTENKHSEKIGDLFTHRFHALIKKLNSQLIWRLHQERNPMARPYIKDFPLQVERVKELVHDFLVKFSAALPTFPLQTIYLTSALQTKEDPENNIIDEANNTQRALQIFKEPTPVTRSYFIKQFLSHGLVNTYTPTTSLPAVHSHVWKHRFAYAVSMSVIGCTAVWLGRDFEHGIKQAYAIQNNLADYRVAIAQSQDLDEHLQQTLTLLNTLQQATKNKKFEFSVAQLLAFYSHQSQQKANTVYYQALHTILLPEVKNYFEEYLKNPVNKNADTVYAVLKAYLMLGEQTHFDAGFITNAMRQILPKKMRKEDVKSLIKHINIAFNSNWNRFNLNAELVQETRHYFIAMPGLQLSYVILKNFDRNNVESEINLGTNSGAHPVLVSDEVSKLIPAMFTVKAFTNILSEQANVAAQETILGNWVLGEAINANKSPDLANSLSEQLRTTYVSKYISAWENLLTNIHLAAPTDLAQTDRMIINLVSHESPLLQLLRTVHDNTYFDPVASSSQKLLNLGALLTKDNPSEELLNQIFASLRLLHQYLQPILSADDTKKAAFYAVSVRMKNHSTPDAITQLRIIAEKSPEPIKNWLEKIANHSWHFLMREAATYIDTSWRNQVTHIYEAEIANHYPFTTNTDREVDIDKFAQFFGNPGIVFNFYTRYLQTFVDASTSDWNWKTVEDNKLPFTDESLRQIQHALRIHHSFFPNGDDKLYVQFTLQPYQFDKLVKRVTLNINNKQFTDDSKSAKSSKDQHVIAWPSSTGAKWTSVKLVMQNKQRIQRDFPGLWGWFRLVNQSFESVVTKKEMLLNLSVNEHPAKYLLFTTEQFNPFISLNLRHFRLPEQLSENKA